MFRTLLLLKLLKYLTSDGGHLGFSEMAATEGAHLGSLKKLVDYGHEFVSSPGPKLVLVEGCEQSWCF